MVSLSRLDRPDFNFHKLMLFYNRNNKIFYTITYCEGNGVLYSFLRHLKKDEKIVQSYLCLNQLVKNTLRYEPDRSENVSLMYKSAEVLLVRGTFISGLALITDKGSEEARKDRNGNFKYHLQFHLIDKIEHQNFQDLRAGKEIEVNKKEVTKDLASFLNEF